VGITAKYTYLVRVWLLVAIMLSVPLGCDDGPKRGPPEQKPTPTCRVVKNGEPVQPRAGNLAPGEQPMELIFIVIEGDDAGKRYSAIARSDQPGAFSLLDQNAKGIPPGKYRVALLFTRGMANGEPKEKFGLEQSPIVVEVKEGEDLTIDLADYP